jgi:hypothetical protein
LNLELDSTSDKIALAVTAFSVIVILVNVGFMFSPDQSPFEELVTWEQNQAQQGQGEDQEPTGYYQVAADDNTRSGGLEDDSAETSQYNLTEQVEIERSFGGFVERSERENGVFLTRKPVSGEPTSVQVYSAGEPVEGAEITVNGEVIGETPVSGDLVFTVPDADRLVVRASTENLGPVEQTYEVYG